MTRKVHVTRRALMLGALCAPSLVRGAPLVDTSTGGSMFSKTSYSPSDTRTQGLLNMFSDPEPDLAPGVSLAPRQSPLFGMSRPLRLALSNANTGEEMTFNVAARTPFSPSEKRRLDHFLRDWRQNEIKEIDGAVLQAFLRVCEDVAPEVGRLSVRITSGYRSRKTNDLLRRMGKKAARNSLHMQARAIDFSLPGVPMKTLSRVARQVCPGGVGTYSTFVHVDSGPQRSWTV
jgi:uncharacterized protein YcbK (DUF882 family)